MWTEQGHLIRDRAGNDELVLDALRIMLPPYIGDGLTLYRGESVERSCSKKYGFAWSSREEVAVKFGRGLNAVEPDGGIVLSIFAPRDQASQ
jgi:hypothetical protein